MASRRSRQRQTAEAAKWIAWAESENRQEIDTSDECVDQDDFDGEQYGSRVPEQERD
jgi:hypothetical protein